MPGCDATFDESGVAQTAPSGGLRLCVSGPRNCRGPAKKQLVRATAFSAEGFLQWHLSMPRGGTAKDETPRNLSLCKRGRGAFRGRVKWFSSPILVIMRESHSCHLATPVVRCVTRPYDIRCQ
jgi:hypothetical protein